MLSDDPRVPHMLLVHLQPVVLFGTSHLLLAAKEGCMRMLEFMFPWFPAIRAHDRHDQQLRGLGGGGGGRAAAKAMRRLGLQVARHAGEQGASLALLKRLHQERGLPVDVAAVAAGGSVQAVEWAVWAQLQQELTGRHTAPTRGIRRVRRRRRVLLDMRASG